MKELRVAQRSSSPQRWRAGRRTPRGLRLLPDTLSPGPARRVGFPRDLARPGWEREEAQR